MKYDIPDPNARLIQPENKITTLPIQCKTTPSQYNTAHNSQTNSQFTNPVKHNIYMTANHLQLYTTGSTTLYYKHTLQLYTTIYQPLYSTNYLKLYITNSLYHSTLPFINHCTPPII